MKHYIARFLPRSSFVCAVTASLLCAQSALSQSTAPNASGAFLDATATHVPNAPTLHALDAAFVDVDRDGDLDVILAVEGDVNRLYLNDGKARLRWRQGAFGTIAHDTEHVLSDDFNRDGYADVMFIAEDDHVHQLFYGDGKGAFMDVSDRLPTRSEGNGFAIGDVNRDGLPDVVLGNSGERGQNFLWLNDRDRLGHFVDATRTHLPVVNDATQDVALADLDRDGDLDMVVANEAPPNRLLLNDGEGRFADVSDQLQLPVEMHTREVHVFDATGDGKPDLLFLNLTSNARDREKDPQARLLVNDGRGQFIDETARRLPTNTFSSWGGAVVDFNDDGHSDLIVGAIEVPGFKPLQARAYANDGRGAFKDVTSDVMPATMVGRSWSMAVGDLDGDGKDDVFIGGWGTQARLLLRKR
ncbi:MAG: FG-GAP repeat domain-containing protein [Steroidobacter sp.]